MLSIDLPVRTEIAPRDAMYHGNDDHYFGVGRSAVRCIDAALTAAEIAPSSIQRLLDLGCGHGRVLRALRAMFPDAELVATDVDADGVEFCATQFGAVPVVAPPDPSTLELGGPFDLIWCGSVLTHLGQEPFITLIRKVASGLGADGIAVVTTHGRRVAARITSGVDDYGLGAAQSRALASEAAATGFAYRDYPNASGYGISLCTASWLTTTLARELPNVRVTAFMETAWDHHQDVLAITVDA